MHYYCTRLVPLLDNSRKDIVTSLTQTSTYSYTTHKHISYVAVSQIDSEKLYFNNQTLGTLMLPINPDRKQILLIINAFGVTSITHWSPRGKLILCLAFLQPWTDFFWSIVLWLTRRFGLLVYNGSFPNLIRGIPVLILSQIIVRRNHFSWWTCLRFQIGGAHPILANATKFLYKVRIQIFSSGGSNLPQKLRSNKKTTKGERALQYLFCIGKVEILFSHWNSFRDNNISENITSPVFTSHPKHIWHGYFSIVKYVIGVTVRGGGGLVVLPKDVFGLNSVKSCKFRQNDKINMEMHFHESQMSCVWHSGRRDFGTWKWLGFIKYVFYVQYLRSKRARK